MKNLCQASIRTQINFNFVLESPCLKKAFSSTETSPSGPTPLGNEGVVDNSPTFPSPPFPTLPSHAHTLCEERAYAHRV